MQSKGQFTPSAENKECQKREELHNCQMISLALRLLSELSCFEIAIEVHRVIVSILHSQSACEN